MTESARPLRADAARNRALVLVAARRVFAARGLGATLDDIAREAGVGSATVYRRFSDREELIEALFAERIDEAVELALECLRDADPWAGLLRLLREIAGQLAHDRGMRQILLSSVHGREGVARARARIGPLTDQLLRRAQAAGAIRMEAGWSDIPLLLLMVGAAADFAETSAPELWERALALLLNGLRTLGEPLPGRPLSQEQLADAMGRWHAPRPGENQ